MNNSGVNNFDWNTISTLISDLSAYEAHDGELSAFSEVKTELDKFNANHENFLDKVTEQLDPKIAGTIANDYLEGNNKYNELINGLNTAYSQRGIDEDGYVESGDYSAETAGSMGGSVPTVSSTPTNIQPQAADTISSSKGGTGSPIDVPKSDIQLKEIETSKSDTGTIGRLDTGSTSGTSISPSTIGDVGMAGNLAVAGGTAIGGALSTTLGDVGGLGSADLLNNINYPLGNYAVSGNFRDNLTDEEKEEISSTLRNYGYTEEEIEKVLDGEYNTPNVLVDELTDKLNDLISKEPGIRKDVIDKYGFDIFNEDGSVNKDKLSMALYIDDIDGKDNYSMLNMLSSKYGVEIADYELLSNYSTNLEQLLLKNYSIKDTIKDKYGFDIYNNDGTVNKDRLALAMLIDSKEKGKTISDIMNESTSNNIAEQLNSSIRNIGKTSSTDKKNGIDGLTATAAVLAAGGAAAGIGFAVNKAKKAESKKEEGKEIIQKDNNNNASAEEKNEWVDKYIEENY